MKAGVPTVCKKKNDCVQQKLQVAAALPGAIGALFVGRRIRLVVKFLRRLIVAVLRSLEEKDKPAP